MAGIKNKKKYTLLILSLALILSFPVFLSKNGKERDANTKEENKNISQVCFNSKCFNVEIADSPEEQETGLMNREGLEQNRGMLFIFGAEDKYNFWMKNTLMPLDIIWISKENRIVCIKNNAQPCKTNPCEVFYPSEKAKYILEINGNTAEKMGLKVDDIAELK